MIFKKVAIDIVTHTHIYILDILSALNSSDRTHPRQTRSDLPLVATSASGSRISIKDAVDLTELTALTNENGEKQKNKLSWSWSFFLRFGFDQSTLVIKHTPLPTVTISLHNR